MSNDFTYKVIHELSENSTDDNVDIEVHIKNKKYFITIFTIKNIVSLLKNHKHTGECLNGTYFWSCNMVIVEELTEKIIDQVISDLVSSGEIKNLHFHWGIVE